MNWTRRLSGLTRWRRGTTDAPAESTPDAAAPSQEDGEQATRNHLASEQYVQRAQRRSAKVRDWRRRVLVKKGAAIHRGLIQRAEHASLAVLDSGGFVVSWYEPPGAEAMSNVLDRHVAQFYIPDDIAMSLPLRDLNTASLHGGSTQQAWRRRSTGAVFWSTTTINAVKLRDGRLQGYTFMMRASQGPTDIVRGSKTRAGYHEDVGDLLHGARRAMGASYA